MPGAFDTIARVVLNLYNNLQITNHKFQINLKVKLSITKTKMASFIW